MFNNLTYFIANKSKHCTRNNFPCLTWLFFNNQERTKTLIREPFYMRVHSFHIFATTNFFLTIINSYCFNVSKIFYYFHDA